MQETEKITNGKKDKWQIGAKRIHDKKKRISWRKNHKWQIGEKQKKGKIVRK